MIPASNNIQSTTLTAGARLGRYEILTKVASGGMAVVYVARASGAAGFQRLVALKVLHGNLAHEAEFVGMFLDEARLAARIRHPNVVATLNICESADSGYFLVMDYVEGGHLGRLMTAASRDGARMPPRIALRIVSDVLAGLGAAHDLTDERGERLNLVHRDVSPHNVLVGIDGSSRLTDFGVAKAEDRITTTRIGQVKGKLAYMAPEQAMVGALDRRGDLFAAGIILWECLCGRRLFRAENPAATLNLLLHSPIQRPSQVDPQLAPLDDLLMRALARDPDLRFPDSESFVTEIERVATAVGGVASQREVARFSRKLLGARIERERAAIRSAEVSLRGDASAEVSEPSGIASPSSTGASSPSSTDASSPSPTGASSPSHSDSEVGRHALPAGRKRFNSGIRTASPQPGWSGTGADLQTNPTVPARRQGVEVQGARARNRKALSAMVLALGVAAVAAVVLVGPDAQPRVAPPAHDGQHDGQGGLPTRTAPAAETNEAPEPAQVPAVDFAPVAGQVDGASTVAPDRTESQERSATQTRATRKVPRRPVGTRRSRMAHRPPTNAAPDAPSVVAEKSRSGAADRGGASEAAPVESLDDLLLANPYQD